jgi:hypothetical protein
MTLVQSFEANKNSLFYAPMFTIIPGLLSFSAAMKQSMSRFTAFTV